MSFLQPEKVPVKVYLSTDKDAPRLDRTPNCVATILKACLVTGYGDKEGAGWTMPFEDTTKGAKVLKPADSPHIPFFMRLSQDTGREMTVQVYQEMSDIDTGELKLQCDTPFKYAIGSPISHRWVVIACGRAFWLFHETGNRNGIKTTQLGTYLYCGDTAKNTRGERAVYLKHTGGSWGVDYEERYDIFYNSSNGGVITGKLFDITNPFNLNPQSFFDGKKSISTRTLLSPVVVMAGGEVWALPAFGSSTLHQDNYALIEGYGREFINHSTATAHIQNFYVPTDYWEF